MLLKQNEKRKNNLKKVVDRCKKMLYYIVAVAKQAIA